MYQPTRPSLVGVRANWPCLRSCLPGRVGGSCSNSVLYMVTTWRPSQQSLSCDT